MSLRLRVILPAAVLAAGVLAACSNGNEPAAEDHDPVRYTVTVNGTLMTDDTLRLTAGGTDTVQFSFFNAADENLDIVEAEHYSLLTFTPATGLTATPEAAHHYQHVIVNTLAAGVAGDLAVGFGHDTLADEHSFPAAYLTE